MVLCMAMFYGPQAAQVNEELVLESFPDLTLMQYPHNEDLEPRKVHVYLEVDPLRAKYYRISLNSCTLVILLQVDLAFSDEHKTICEGCYETKNIFIFAWSLIFNVGHYCWLCDLIY